MTTAIDRTAHLETTIRDAETELAALRSEAETERRMKSASEELRRFREIVGDARRLLAKFDDGIDSTIAAMKAEAEGSVTVDFRGVVANEPAHVARITQFAEKLRSDLLGRARHNRQLRDLETRLEGMERENEQRPAKWRA